MWYGMLYFGAHAYRKLIGVCNAMVCPIHGVQVCQLLDFSTLDYGCVRFSPSVLVRQPRHYIFYFCPFDVFLSSVIPCALCDALCVQAPARAYRMPIGARDLMDVL